MDGKFIDVEGRTFANFSSPASYRRNVVEVALTHVMPTLNTSRHIHAIPSPLPTPIPQLNGLPRGSLTEIYGTPGSGKTQLLLTLATHALSVGNVLLLDADAGIEPIRLAQLRLSIPSARTAHTSRLIRLHTFRDLVVLLHSLPDVIRSIGGAVFIGVDSLTTIFRTLRVSEPVKRLESIAWKLREIAVNHNAAVVLTNQARLVENVRIVSSMGETWRHVCGTRLCTETLSQDRKIKIIKSVKSKGEIHVEITESGVNVS